MIDHRPACPGGDTITKRGRLGGVIRKCRGCGRVEELTGTEADQAAATLPALSGPFRLPGPDSTDHRQIARRGDGWPTHRRRARNQRQPSQRKDKP